MTGPRLEPGPRSSAASHLYSKRQAGPGFDSCAGARADRTFGDADRRLLTARAGWLDTVLSPSEYRPPTRTRQGR